MPHLFIINPRGGGGRAAGVWRFLREELFRLNVAFEAVMTEYPGHGALLARQRASDYHTVVAVGGDGTLHEVGNGLLMTNGSGGAAVCPMPNLGWIPAGTGNDLARTAGVPLSPRRALELVLAAPTRLLDAGRVNEKVFLNVAGVGFDARVAQEVSRSRVPAVGPLPYILAALRLLARLDNPTIQLYLDDVHIVQKVLLVAVGNCRYYGGGMMVCPRAVEDDGLFDVCLVGDLTRLEALRALKAAFKGKHVDLPKIQYHTARTITMDGPPDLPVHADGQIVGTLPVRFDMLPRAIKFICRPQESVENPAAFDYHVKG